MAFVPHAKRITVADLPKLRSLRISTADVCDTCDGYGRVDDHRRTCQDCGGTGRIPATIHRNACQGDGCDCGDTDHA